MLLAILGAAALVLGAVLAIPGLMAAGGLWALTGLYVTVHNRRFERDRAERAPGPETDPKAKTAHDRKVLLVNILLKLGVGLPSLAIGIVGLGFDEDQAAWRWVPIVVGGLLTLLALLAGLMYLLGAGLTAAAGDGNGAAAQHPATITIRAMRETGTFINERPRLEFELLVEPEGMASYEVTKRATVPFTALGSLRVGDGFRAKVVGADQPTEMEIDWDAPVQREEEEDTAQRLRELERLRASGQVTAEEYESQRRRIIESI